MEKIISFDKNGRLYLPEEIRKFLQYKTVLVRTQEKSIILEPIEEDPLIALEILGKGKLGKPIKQLKEEARESIKEDAIKKIRR
jgi:bifunctional DNA-binding transcriptional regulator/antitoxin component of YhaV-PrlF toxin-antitoxin module